MNLTDRARQALAAQTVAELRDLARAAEVPGRSRMRKADLVESLLPAQLAELEAADARRAEAVSRETAEARLDESLPLHSPLSAAIRAKNQYLEVVARRGQENGGPEVSAAWEDYLDACDAAETCTRTDCWDRATDGDGRCGRHSWGAALGADRVQPAADVSPETAAPADPRRAEVARCEAAYLAAADNPEPGDIGPAWEDYMDACDAAEVCTKVGCWEPIVDDGRCPQHLFGAALGDDVSRETTPAADPCEGCGHPDHFDSAPADLVAEPAPRRSGYTDCACPDCFDIAVSRDMASPDLCGLCSEAGCGEPGDTECQRDDAYED